MATMKMVMKDGKSVPAFAADGKGKMRNGGKVKKYGNGGKTSGVDKSTTNTTKGEMMKMSKGGKVTKKAMPKKAMGGKMNGKAC